jgi:hypothetical protein
MIRYFVDNFCDKHILYLEMDFFATLYYKII